jgi:hypothetical protein
VTELGARETATEEAADEAADEAAAEAPVVTAEAPTDTVMVEAAVVVTPTSSLLRDQDGVPPEWVALSDQLLRHVASSFVVVNVLATEKDLAMAPSNSNPRLKFLCLDCVSGNLLATGGGTKKGCSAANFETSHLKGSRHKKAAGAGGLARYDRIVATEPSQGEPEYYGFVRELDLRRRGHFAGVCASNSNSSPLSPSTSSFHRPGISSACELSSELASEARPKRLRVPLLRALEPSQPAQSNESILAALVEADSALEDLETRGVVRCVLCALSFGRAHHVALRCVGLVDHVKSAEHKKRVEAAKGQCSLFDSGFSSRARGCGDAPPAPPLRTPPSSSDHV